MLRYICLTLRDKSHNQMPETLFKVDLTKTMEKQDIPGHNRWHPDISAVVSVKHRDVFLISKRSTGGKLTELILISSLWANIVRPYLNN